VTAIEQPSRSADVEGDLLDISVVLPCLNEATSVGLCITEARAAIAQRGWDGEVIVVDNGSDDGSDVVAVEHGASVVFAPERGYGSALRAGIAKARGRVVVMADADCSYDLSNLAELARPVVDGDLDLHLGSRFDGRERGSMPALHRHVGTPLLTFLVSRAGAKCRLSDSQSGYRAFDRAAINELGLSSTGMEFASEMLIEAGRAGLRIGETPMGYRTRVGESKLDTFRDGLRHLRLIVLLAPSLFLLWPGLTIAGLGIALTAQALAEPTGLVVGSLRWQPVFFSTIAIVLGMQAALAGAVISRESPVARHSAERRADALRFFRRCTRAGVVTIAIGGGIDAFLFVRWVDGADALTRQLALASLAQSLLIVGMTTAVVGVMCGLIRSRTQRATVAVEVMDVL
jgi:hypothetical protein